MRFATLTVISAICFLLFSCSKSISNYPISNHFDGEVFYNLDHQVTKNFIDVIHWKLGFTQKEWPNYVEISDPKNNAEKFKNNKMPFITSHINHATHLIKFDEVNVITDPIFSMRCSPFQWIGPKRVHQPGMSLEHLPQIDFVVISHNHYDHMDEDSLKEIHKKHQAKFIVPLGNKIILEKVGIKNIVELDWWESYKIKNLSITLVPAQHWSLRLGTSRNVALWGGYIFEYQNGDTRKTSYFSGDTGFGSFFHEIRKRFPRMDLALLAIGAYEPRWFMKEQHINPKDAIRIHQILSSKLSIASHYGTFQLSDEEIDQPVKKLNDLLKRSKKNKYPFIATSFGDLVSF